MFVDPENKEIHTNNVERLWQSVKEAMLWVSEKNYKEHLKLYMYSKYFLTGGLDHDFNTVLKQIYY